MARKAKLKVSTRLLRKKARRSSFSTGKQCRFCSSDAQAATLDYKNGSMLRGFITERCKILPSRISGNCARHQRALAQEIKKARIMALLPFTSSHTL
jgi:small subunit ribosomal protein S18